METMENERELTEVEVLVQDAIRTMPDRALGEFVKWSEVLDLLLDVQQAAARNN